MKTPTPDEIQYMLEHVNETKVPGLIACSVVCIFTASLAVVLRFVARYASKIKLRWSDWLILIALVFLYMETAAVLCTIPYGMGKHAILVKNPRILTIWMLIAETTITMSVMAIKLSLCCLYAQIFPLGWVKQAGILISLIVIAYTVAHIVSDVLQCIPLAALWDPTITDAKCYPFIEQMTAMGIINILTDITIFLLPVRPIWGLMVSRTRKWQLSLLLSLGAFACIVSIVRVFYVRKMGSSDPTWDDVEAGELSIIEPTIGILAACLPACRLLLNRMFKTSVGVQCFYSSPRTLNVLRTDGYELSDSSKKVGHTEPLHAGSKSAGTLDDEERLVFETRNSRM